MRVGLMLMLGMMLIFLLLLLGVNEGLGPVDGLHNALSSRTLKLIE